ncbi:hypothetical protein [Paraglaciecola sp.]|uniref:hypothetical protein n=1 Tax=Paraglaciecola sp. TaxID=1920173 RepID=UPI003F4AAAF2
MATRKKARIIRAFLNLFVKNTNTHSPLVQVVPPPSNVCLSIFHVIVSLILTISYELVLVTAYNKLIHNICAYRRKQKRFRVNTQIAFSYKN